MCGANLSDGKLQIAMCEVDSEQQAEMFKEAKQSLTSSASKVIPIKEEPMYTLSAV